MQPTDTFTLRKLERITSLSRDRLARILEAITPADTTGGHPQYTIKQIIRALIADLSEGITLEQQKILESQAKIAESQTRKARLDIQVAEMKEDLVSIEEVDDLIGNALTVLRSRLLALPAKIGPRVVNQDIPEIVAAIQEEIYQGLDECAEALMKLQKPQSKEVTP